jgi:3-hydroxyacyl-[acyl-carrier-protein] dehydratase
MSEKKEIYLDILGIQKKIPHRFPFLLIDRIDSYTDGPNPKSWVGRKVVARKNVTFNEPYFTGHFPHKPVMPGVLQVEAMAQAGAVACIGGVGGPAYDVLIAKINNARFRRPVVPGDVLEIHAEITNEKSGIVSVSCRALCDGEVVAETELVAKVFPLVKDA